MPDEGWSVSRDKVNRRGGEIKELTTPCTLTEYLPCLLPSPFFERSE